MPVLDPRECSLTLPLIAERMGAHRSTVMRWIRDGVRNPRGVRVHLEAIRIGATWKTTPAALAEFERACNDRGLPLIRTPAQRKRDQAKAYEELRRLGVKC